MSTEVNPFRDFGRNCVCVNADLEQRPKRYGGENVKVAIQVPTVHGDVEIAGPTLKCIEVSRQPRITNIERVDRAVDFVR